MLQYDLARRGFSLKDVSWPSLQFCTVEQTAPQFGRRMKLIELYRHYVGEYEQKHRALDDVMRLHAVCQRIDLYGSVQSVWGVAQ